MLNSIFCSRSFLWMAMAYLAITPLMFPGAAWGQARGIIDGGIARPANSVNVSGNDTDAINRAIRIGERDQRPVWVPQGNYMIDATVRVLNNTQLVMHRDAILTRATGYDGELMGTNNRDFLRTNIHIEGGRFDSASSDGGVIRAWGTDWVITNVHIRNFRGIAVKVKGNGHLVTRSTFEGPEMRTGETNFDGTAAIHVYGGDGIRINRLIVESGDDGIPVQPNRITPIIPTRDCIIEDCTITSFEGAAIVAGTSNAGGEVSGITFRNIEGFVSGAMGRENGGSLATITNTGPNQAPFPTTSATTRDILYQNVHITATGIGANAQTGFAIRTRNGNWVENVRVIDCFFGPESNIDGFGIIIDQVTSGDRNNRDIELINSTFEGDLGARITRPEGRFVNCDNTISEPVQINTFPGTLTTGVILGDVDLNCEVNFLDISPFIGLLSSGGFREEADINLDGNINFLDLAPFIQILSGS